MGAAPIPLCVECASEGDARRVLDAFTPCAEAEGKSVRVVYVDGACTGNGAKHASAGVGVYWGPGHANNVSRPVSGPVHTNNVGELQAIQDALGHIGAALAADPALVDKAVFRIMSDSMYSINCTTVWHDGWRARGWKTASGGVPQNLALIRAVHDTLQDFQDAGLDIKLLYTPAHKNREYGPGNDAADRLAKLGASGAGAESGAGAVAVTSHAPEDTDAVPASRPSRKRKRAVG